MFILTIGSWADRIRMLIEQFGIPVIVPDEYEAIAVSLTLLPHLTPSNPF